VVGLYGPMALASQRRRERHRPVKPDHGVNFVGEALP